MSRQLCENLDRTLRAVGLDDGPLTRDGTAHSRGSKASLLAVWFTGLRVDQVRLDVLEVDGLNVTDVILRLLSGTATDIIFLSGVSFAGFNIVDARRIFGILHVPIIIVSRDEPDNASVKRALKKHFADWKIRWKYIQALGRIYTFAPKTFEPPLYFEAVGISAARAKGTIRSYCATSRVPEPIRIAGILARGLRLSARELASG